MPAVDSIVTNTIDRGIAQVRSSDPGIGAEVPLSAAVVTDIAEQ